MTREAVLSSIQFMKEVFEDIFSLAGEFDAICITTNGVVKANGEAVMGAGIAKSCAEKWPTTPAILGKLLKEAGRNVPFQLGCVTRSGEFLSEVRVEEEFVCRIFSFPTKNDWRDNSDLNLIKESCHFMMAFADRLDLKHIAIPRPGCGLGGLNWEKEVKPAIRGILDDRFFIVTTNKN